MARFEPSVCRASESGISDGSRICRGRFESVDVIRDRLVPGRGASRRTPLRGRPLDWHSRDSDVICGCRSLWPGRSAPSDEVGDDDVICG